MELSISDEKLVGISVILCTRNPKTEILSRTISGLSAQLVDAHEWELIVVDNGSQIAVESLDGIEWPANVRHVVELQPGLTAARLCGIQESQEELLVFVDDDNYLESDYLQYAIAIGQAWPQLGTWGGSISPRWEKTPPDWTQPYWNWLAVRELDRDLWSNVPFDAKSHPYGAGLCVRRQVATQYAKDVNEHPLRRGLDRSGDSLIGGGDADLNFTAVKLGFGTGVFRHLRLQHWMPKERLTEQYLLRLVEDMTYSHHILLYIWGRPPTFPSRSQRLLIAYQSFFVDERTRRFDAAKRRGLMRAIEQIKKTDLQVVAKCSNGN